MAGSYQHVVDDDGNLLPSEGFVEMILNLDDAYDAVEEMYGMIWWLAGDATSARRLVEDAHQNYQQGLAFAREVNAA